MHKTGGTTFQKILEALFHRKYHFCRNPEVKNIAKQLKKYACLELHADKIQGEFVLMTRDILQPANRYLLRDAQIFMLFRHPATLYLSLYNHVLRNRADLISFFERRGHPFPETLDGYISIVNKNQQTGFLAGNIQRPEDDIVSEKDLDYVKELLVDLNINVGIMERYADFLHIFETVSGITLPNRTIEIKNRHPKKVPYASVSEEIKEKIIQGNNLDMSLYAFAIELFEKQLAQCGPRPEYIFI